MVIILILIEIKHRNLHVKGGKEKNKYINVLIFQTF